MTKQQIKKIHVYDGPLLSVIVPHWPGRDSVITVAIQGLRTGRGKNISCPLVLTILHFTIKKCYVYLLSVLAF